MIGWRGGFRPAAAGARLTPREAVNKSFLAVRSAPCRTTLLTIGILIAGVLGFVKLPVSPLPKIDFPVIMVQAQLPGASPATVATSVAEPLERHLGQIADVDEMTSESGLGQTRIILQFDLSRNIDGAARDVQAAINAARADLPPRCAAIPSIASSIPPTRRF